MSNRREYSRRYDENDSYGGRRRHNDYGRRERNNQSYDTTTKGYNNRLSDNNVSSMQDNVNDKMNDSSAATMIFVNTRNVGKLIGKSGSQIRALQDKSNTTITIDKQASTYGKTPVSIYGTQKAQEQAWRLIKELLGEDSSTSQQSLDSTRRTEDNAEIDFTNFDWAKANRECDEYQKQMWSSLTPIVKNFYIEDPVVANMTKAYVANLRKTNNNIEVKCDSKDGESNQSKIPNPIETFEQAFQHYPDILREIRKQGFQKPSPIQCQAWPILLSGQDLIGIAQTGTGKTLAFLLPALIHIDGQKTPRSELKGPSVLVMAPTRELALQIEKEVGKYSYHDIKAVCVYGGGNRKAQIDTVTKGVQIVIATPGRLNDLIQANVLDVSSVTYLILDEADRMLDMGFEPQIRKALLNVRPDRQSVMTSATWPQGVRRLVQSYMQNPIQVFVGSLDLAAVHTVTQRICMIDDEEKNTMMRQFFREMGPDDKVIVFFGKKAMVDHISSDLALEGIDCQSIHGNREQGDREQALEDMKTGIVRILLATDVASRGLDIEDITHVLNYDFPRDIEEYVHRVGRTGRAGRTGESITFMTRKDWSHAKELINILEEANQEVPEELYQMAERYEAWKEKKKLERGFGNRGGYGQNRSRYRNDW